MKRRIWNWIWLKLCRFCYRRIIDVAKHPPDGIPTIRDHRNPCHGYSPNGRRIGNWAGCQGDGHYLCKECVHFTPPPTAEED